MYSQSMMSCCNCCCGEGFFNSCGFSCSTNAFFNSLKNEAILENIPWGSFSFLSPSNYESDALLKEGKEENESENENEKSNRWNDKIMIIHKSLESTMIIQ
jgi:hypothetical protein